MIPKKIISIHKSYAHMPLFDKVSWERWKLLHPDHNCELFTNDHAHRYVYEFVPDLRKEYDSLPFGAQIDIQRAAIMYMHGGIYTDSDMYPVRSVSSVIDRKEDLVVFSAPNADMFLCSIFAAQAKHPIFLEFVRHSIRRLVSTLQPDIKNSDAWCGWQLYATVHLWNDLFLEWDKKIADAVPLAGYHSHDLPEVYGYPTGPRPLTIHFSSAHWKPENKSKQPADYYHDQNVVLTKIHNLYGQS